MQMNLDKVLKLSTGAINRQDSFIKNCPDVESQQNYATIKINQVFFCHHVIKMTKVAANYKSNYVPAIFHYFSLGFKQHCLDKTNLHVHPMNVS